MKIWLLAGLAVFLTAPAAPGAETAAPRQAPKVVRQYALTSANDFPQRDPFDWRLLASNDGGVTWATLDVRTGELFTERHQRRVFKIHNETAYNIYRLQIDRVRNPAEGNSVQLAEIDPMGAGEDDFSPAPTLKDVITAQGEHLISESATRAFDGQLETKWLDFSVTHPRTRSSWIQWEYVDQAGIVVTNVGDLAALGHGAARGFNARVEGVIVGVDETNKVVSFLDLTGILDVPCAAWASLPSPGARVILEGTSAWTNAAVSLHQPRCTEQQPPPRNPLRLALEQAMPAGEDLIWVETEGTVRFSAGAGPGLTLELEDGGKTISAHVLHGDFSQRPSFYGARVRVRGIGRALLDTEGRRVIGAIWIPDLASISEASPRPPATQAAAASAPAEETPSILTEIRQIRELDRSALLRSPKVRLRAIANELFGTFVQDGTGGIEIWQDFRAAGRASFGDELELEGRAGWEGGHGPVVRPDKIKILGPGKLPSPQRASYNLLAGGQFVDQWVEVETVVRATDGSHLLLSCDGQELMATIRLAKADVVEGLVDATIRARGVATAASDDRGKPQGIHLVIPSMEFVEVEHPARDPFSLAAQPIGNLLEVTGASGLVHRVRTRGVLTLTQDHKYFVQDATGGAMVIPKQNVILSSREGAANWVFWRSATSDDTSAAEHVAVSDEVEVVGFPESKGYSPILTESLLRKIRPATPVAPVKVTPADIALGRLDAALVTLDATVLREDSLGPDRVLALQSGQTLFRGFLKAGEHNSPAVAPGSRVRVTGVCQIEPLPYAELGKSAPSFALSLRAPTDLVVLESPPWWTLRRTLTMCAGLIILLAITSAWIRILRRQVEQRTEQLRQEIEEHKQTEASLAEKSVLLRNEVEERKVVQRELQDKKSSLEMEIEERKRVEAEVERIHKELLLTSRQAGMAEVASSVLHNVGNVLNSANVSGELISRELHNSKAADVARLARLLAQQGPALIPFLTEDERGRRLPAYLTALGENLAGERARLASEVKSLNDNISHIKAIVARQQDYAKIAGVLESISLADIVSDALVMLRAGMERHGIQVVADFQDGPVMIIDRHKVLQIVFNLLQNASQACEAGGRPDKRVVVAIRLAAPDRVSIRVADNGVGIPKENLARIFSQGFSTRKGGHGIGLHSSILMAQEMGAMLVAHSEGLGHGAVFTLDLPLHPSRKKEREAALPVEVNA
ncbi:MAG TPA: ATP-binding protein [Verrucomicrobiae bacterium]|nr:ATP-binding protein [Verrucomicrobiae bacterium]